MADAAPLLLQKVAVLPVLLLGSRVHRRLRRPAESTEERLLLRQVDEGRGRESRLGQRTAVKVSESLGAREPTASRR